MAERCIPGSLRFFTGSSTPDREWIGMNDVSWKEKTSSPAPKSVEDESNKREQQMLGDGSATKVEETEEDKRGERPHSRYHPYM
jgi:hypothetical protein